MPSVSISSQSSTSSLPIMQKCTVVNLDAPNTPTSQIPGYFNPKQIKIGKSIPWSGHPSKSNDYEMLEFTCGKNQTMTVELFFDGYEQGINVQQCFVFPLIELTRPTVKDTSGKGGAKRPPFVMIVWGKFFPFKGVIDSIDTDYTMFLPDGTPVRATCTLKLTEVDVAQMNSGAKSRVEQRQRDAGY